MAQRWKLHAEKTAARALQAISGTILEEFHIHTPFQYWEHIVPSMRAETCTQYIPQPGKPYLKNDRFSANPRTSLSQHFPMLLKLSCLQKSHLGPLWSHSSLTPLPFLGWNFLSFVLVFQKQLLTLCYLSDKNIISSVWKVSPSI